MPATTYFKNAIRDHINGVATYTPPATVYWAAHTGNPGATGAANEVSGGAYERKSMPNDGTGWNAASAGSADILAIIEFVRAVGANWGTITHISKWDAISGGNCEEYCALAANKVVNDGDYFELDVTSTAA